MRVKRGTGQALVEFALVAPLLFTLLALILEFGWTYYNLYYLNSLARMAARALASQTTANNTVASTIIQSFGGSVNSAAATVTVTQVIVNVSSVSPGPQVGDAWSNPVIPPATAIGATDRSPGNLLTVYYSFQYWPFTRLVDLRNFGGPTHLRVRYSFVIQP